MASLIMVCGAIFINNVFYIYSGKVIHIFIDVMFEKGGIIIP